MAFNLPQGQDWADGETPLPSQPAGSAGQAYILGTPIPIGNLTQLGNDLEEPPGSPTIERAEQCTCSHTIIVYWTDGTTYLGMLQRGTFVMDTFADVWRILSSTLRRTAGGLAELSYVAESVSFDSPPDTFSIVPVELGFNILKHPRYTWALSPYTTDASTYTTVGDTNVYYTDIKQAIIRMIQMYIESPLYPNADYINGLIQNNILVQIQNGFLSVTVPNPNFVAPVNVAAGGQSSPPWSWDGTNASLANIPTNVQNLVLSVPVSLTNPSDPVAIAIAAAKEVISKLWRQEDTPYLIGYEVTWTSYYFQPVYLNPGCYIEDPRTIIPAYFITPSSDVPTIIPRGIVVGDGYPGDTAPPPAPGDPTIFNTMIFVNPQDYSDDGTMGGNLIFSCLRKADQMDYERTWFALTSKWLMAPVGSWDADLYTSNPGPQTATDFNNLPPPTGGRQGA